MATMTDGTLAQTDTGECLVVIPVVRILRFGCLYRRLQQLSATLDLLLPVAVAEKAIVADTLKAGRQYVQQEAPNEFRGLQGHGFLGVVIAIILPAESDLSGVDIQQTLFEIATRWV